MSEQDPFKARVSRLVNYLTRAHKHNKPSILFALYLSEFLRADVESSLEKSLKEQGIGIVAVDAGENKDIPAFISSINSKDTVFLVHNLEKGFPEALKFLNFKREELVDNKVKVVFWVKEDELARITLEAPDFFAFRNRVVEFMESPIGKERRPALVDFALETEYKSLDEIKRSIELKEKLLAELSGDDEISGYLLGSLGILYYQISSYKKAIEYSEKALGISREIGDRRGEGNALGNLGNAYYSLDHTEKAIEYYEKALAISREIGDGFGEATLFNNLGIAFQDKNMYKEAFAFYYLARGMFTYIKNLNIKTTESNLESLKEKLGEKEFEKLEAEVAPKAKEIVNQILESKLY